MRRRTYLWVLQICLAVCLMSFCGKALGAENIGLFPTSLKELKLDDVKITWGGEYRFRYESLDSFNPDTFGGKAVKDKSNYPMYGRLRFNVKADYNNVAQVFFEGLDCREWHSEYHPRTQEDSFDVHQLYFKLSKPNDLPVSLSLGRQELKYGVGRLVWASTWKNEIVSFDSVKFTYNPSSFDIDLFAGNRVGYQVFTGPDKTSAIPYTLYPTNRFNDANYGENFFGLYTTYKGIPKNIFDFYFLTLIDLHPTPTSSALLNPMPPTTTPKKGTVGTVGTFERYTAGTRGEGKVLCTGLGYGYEFAYQFGNIRNVISADIRAYAWHLDLNYTFAQLILQPTFKIEYNFASGDKNSNDGVTHTFIPLFSTTHDKLGLIDFFRWENMKGPAVVMNFVPIKDRVNCSLEYHRLYLDESQDAWYDSSGNIIRKASLSKPGQHLSSHVGDEVDISMQYKLFSFLSLEGGYTHLFSGPYVKETSYSKGYTDNDINWFYLQTIVTF